MVSATTAWTPSLQPARVPALRPATTPGGPTARLCGECQRIPPPFDCAFAALRYEAPVDDLVGGFKYHRRLALGRALGDLMAAFLETPPRCRATPGC
jgi:predicted amidophosphoribosyltransferase